MIRNSLGENNLKNGFFTTNFNITRNTILHKEINVIMLEDKNIASVRIYLESA